jgi:hypothetical protein
VVVIDATAPVLPRHKGKQFQTVPAKAPMGGSVGFFHALKYPASNKFDDTTGKVAIGKVTLALAL